jgi:hypothetical protein
MLYRGVTHHFAAQKSMEKSIKCRNGVRYDSEIVKKEMVYMNAANKAGGTMMDNKIMTFVICQVVFSFNFSYFLLQYAFVRKTRDAMRSPRLLQSTPS